MEKRGVTQGPTTLYGMQIRPPLDYYIIIIIVTIFINLNIKKNLN